METARITFFDKITNWLMRRRPPLPGTLIDFSRLSYEIRPCDVLLFVGRSRVSDVIANITHSPWTHAALYLGRLHDIEDNSCRSKVAEHYQGSPGDQLLIESVMGKGTIVTPLTYYKDDHIRICRPKGVTHTDAQKILAYAIARLGLKYDVRQILDLARFFFPWTLFPRRWRSTLFSHNAGEPTKEVCSTLIGEAFGSVNFPVLPLVKRTKDNKVEVYHRIPKLLTPSDFDFSPYFEIIKYPMFDLESSALYRNLPWNQEGKFSDTEGHVITPAIIDETSKEEEKSEPEKTTQSDE